MDNITVRVVLCGLWHDGDGWSENQPYRSAELTMPADISDRAFARRVLASVGATGMRRDHWAGDDCWRDGTIGVYAIVN